MIKYLAGESRQRGTIGGAAGHPSISLGRRREGAEREKRREAASRVTVDVERGCFTSERGTRPEYTMRSECRVILGRASARTRRRRLRQRRTRREMKEGAASLISPGPALLARPEAEFPRGPELTHSISSSARERERERERERKRSYASAELRRFAPRSSSSLPSPRQETQRSIKLDPRDKTVTVLFTVPRTV